MLATALVAGIQADVEYADELELVHARSTELQGETVRVMTANVHGWRGADGSDNMDDLLSAMTDNDVDIACLQEVDITEGQLDKLYDSGLNVLYAETERDGYGNAVISKSDMELKKNYNLPPADSIRQRGALLVQIATKVGEIELLATHVTTKQRYHGAQFGRLGQIAREGNVDEGCGDLNEDLETIAQTTLGEYFSESIASHPRRGNTFPADNPNRSIDFVFSTCQEQGEPALVWLNSDHLGVIHELVLAGCE